jgi:RNA recognition motif-containing protein
MATKTLYVGNLPYSCTQEKLTELFSNYGVTDVRIIEGRGFGFVEIDEGRFDSAVDDKNGMELDGRTIVVKEARPKTEGGGRDSGGGGGRRRSSGGGYGRNRYR